MKDFFFDTPGSRRDTCRGCVVFFLFARARHFFVHTGNACVVCVIEDGLWGF